MKKAVDVARLFNIYSGEILMSKKILKVVIPVVMVVIIGGIWIWQSAPQQATVQAEVVSQDASASTAQEQTQEILPEFALNETSIDLEQLKEYELPIIIDFGADSCIPCKEMAPVLEELNAEMQEKAIIKFVDVWKNPEGATDFPVQVIPTQVLYNADGTPYVPSEDVAAGIAFTMYANKDTEEHMFTVHQGGLTEEQMRIILEDMGVV